MRIAVFLILSLLTSLFSVSSESNKTLAFPDAEGCGKYTTGGRDGKIVYVTNLNDSGEGSLRYALKEVDGKKIILFKVAGTIFLKSIIEVDKGNFTLAGQSAPGEGICVAGDGIDIEANNFIIRYMRFRPGDIDGDETDALTIKRSTNVIVDHCSMSWSTDETCSCYDNTNFTLQWCIISESLNNSVHHKGPHGYGGIWGGMNATFHHNLLASHTSRNPRLQGSRYHKHPELEKAEIVNNVVYNWSMKCIYGGEQGIYAIAGNYFKPGPATGNKASKYILEPYKPFASFYFQNNIIEGNKELSENNLLSVKKKYDNEQLKFYNEYPFQISDYKIGKAEDIYSEVLKNAGASISRDAFDQRIIQEVENGAYTFGQKGIIDTQSQVGNWPTLKSEPAPTDSDNDGMPDEWETQHNLNPQDSSDGNKYAINPNFTNIEVYLNSLCN